MEGNGFFTPDQQFTAGLAKQIDWSTHPLGDVRDWPSCLRLTLNTLFNTRQAVCLFWGEESYYFYNDAYIPILGESKHPWAMGKPGIEVWGEIWEHLVPQIRQVMDTGVASWHVDQFLPIIRQGKPSEAYFTYSYSPIIDEAGKIKGTLVICIETTERVQSSVALEASNERFRQLTATVPQFIWTARADGYTDFLNQQWVEYTGVPMEKQLGSGWLEFIHPEDRARTARIWENAQKDIGHYDVEYRIRRHDGVYRWFKVRGTPLRNSEGVITSWTGACTDIEDTKQAQIEYEKNVDLSPAILWITEKDGRCSYLSKQWYEFTGQTVNEGLGFGWLEATHPDDKERAGKAFMRANENQTFFRVEYRLRDKHGNYRWAIDAGNPRFDSQGNYLGIAGTVFDVHERKIAEQAAKDSREDMYRILMQAPVAVAFLKSPDLVYTIVNDRYKTIIGKGDSILNQPLRKAIPEFEEETFKIFEEVFSHGKPYVAHDYKVSLIRNGTPEEAYFNFVAERILDEHGEPEGVIIVAVEVTEQWRTRQSLEEVNQKLESVVHNISEGLIIADAKGNMLLWNPAALELHGFSSSKDLLKQLGEFTTLFALHDLDDKEMDVSEWPMARVLKGETVRDHEVKVIRKDTGDSLFASYSGSPMKDPSGNITLAILTVRDVSKKYHTEADLKRAINARDDFMSVASHELKTPLTSLKLQTQSAKRRLSMPEKFNLSAADVVKILTQNEGQINRLVRLVDDMLDLTRVQSGRLNYQFRDANLCEILNEVCDRLKEQFEHAQIRLDVKCAKEVHLMIDRDRIEQVIINLLTNALKYGNQKPVDVCLEAHDSHAYIHVRDRGMGIKKENQEIIFDRFQRLVTPNEISGLGIGLYVTKEIVEAHKGRIWVESQSGQGSTFHVELPLQ